MADRVRGDRDQGSEFLGAEDKRGVTKSSRETLAEREELLKKLRQFSKQKPQGDPPFPIAMADP
jgi:hypothetical protein